MHNNYNREINIHSNAFAGVYIMLSLLLSLSLQCKYELYMVRSDSVLRPTADSISWFIPVLCQFTNTDLHFYTKLMKFFSKMFTFISRIGIIFHLLLWIITFNICIWKLVKLIYFEWKWSKYLSTRYNICLVIEYIKTFY